MIRFAEVFILFVIVLIIVSYIKRMYGEVEFVKSGVDGREYLMRRLPDRQEAADLLARINVKLSKLVSHLVAKYGLEGGEGWKERVVKQLYDNYNPDSLSEGGVELGYTSYSVNKGEKIVICLRQKDNQLVDENVLMYVAIHEMGHLATDEIGHTKAFWDNFRWILKEGVSIGIYKKVDFDRQPQSYCGIDISSSVI